MIKIKYFRKAHNISPGDVLEWIDNEKGIIVQPRKKRTLKDIIGLVKAEGDAVESKKRVQKGINSKYAEVGI